MTRRGFIGSLLVVPVAPVIAPEAVEAAPAVSPEEIRFALFMMRMRALAERGWRLPAVAA